MMMSGTRTTSDDPLVLRVHAAAKQLEDLRARLEAERDGAREKLEAALGRLKQMENQRGQARQRIQHILETIHV
jgi:predicted  nucleic acid-binding Zn-ribbon protein